MRKEKLPRNPVFDSIATLDSFIAEGLAAGKTVVQMMSEVLPSIADEREAKAARIKEDNERAAARRLARQAALDDPAKRERERVSWQKRTAASARKKALRLERLELEAKKKARALAENPTLKWRTPRRKNWKPPAGYPGADVPPSEL